MSDTAEKPECNLTQCDGNVFAIIAAVRRSLVRANQDERALEWVNRAMNAESYDEVLQLAFAYVDVT